MLIKKYLTGHKIFDNLFDNLFDNFSVPGDSIFWIMKPYFNFDGWIVFYGIQHG